MLSMHSKWLAGLAAALALGLAGPVSAEPLTKYKPGMNVYKPMPGKKQIVQPMPKPLPIKKHAKHHHGRNVAIGLAAATAAAIAASSSSRDCRRWERQCDDGSRRACRKYEAYCD